MSRKNGKTAEHISNCGPRNTFEEVVMWRFRLNIGRCPRCVIAKSDQKLSAFERYCIGENGVTKENAKRVDVNYHPDNIVIGNEYFVGEQSNYHAENREKYRWGVYSFIGIDKKEDVLIFESKDGKKIEVRMGTVILEKYRIIDWQTSYGFSYPGYLKDAWPDLIENPLHMPEQEYEFGIEPGVRSHIDTFIATVIYAFVLLIFKELKGGSYSFNLGGAVAYYLWFIVGGIVLLAKFFLRKK